jgi:hypothetical protein
MSDRVGDCHKRGFNTEDEALEVLRGIRQNPSQYQPGNRKLPIAVYECDRCALFHLTSRIGKPVKQGRRRRRRRGAMGWK